MSVRVAFFAKDKGVAPEDVQKDVELGQKPGKDLALVLDKSCKQSNMRIEFSSRVAFPASGKKFVPTCELCQPGRISIVMKKEVHAKCQYSNPRCDLRL